MINFNLILMFMFNTPTKFGAHYFQVGNMLKIKEFFLIYLQMTQLKPASVT